MKNIERINKLVFYSIVAVFFVLAHLHVNAQTPLDFIHFNVSMKQPSTHYLHVEMECKGLNMDEYLFKMPTWTPGYYWMINFAKNVTNFSAVDENGNVLITVKTAKDTWQVKGIRNKAVTISYDVFAWQRSVAEPFLDDGRAFIAPTGVFMYPDGQLQHQATVTIHPYKSWTQINTGLEKVKNQENTFYASNFDVLYDSPILAGNQEIMSFDVDGIPYTIAIENPAEFDRETYINDFKKIVKNATNIIGEVPYKHYTFLIMDQGYGGLEHANSMAVFSNSNYDITNSEGYKGWLAFIAHEFFHLYNVKTIRPIALGPFDYSKENLTNMLWVAEGFTVYYEYMVLNRAGLMSRQEVLDALSRVISTFENATGRKYTSATQSSFDTWLNFFNHNNHTQNTIISYYDIGCALGMLTDLKIRYETANEKSLDDVMRTLYFDFHKKQNRGYTDDEFRQVCEKTAGCSLEEIFRYAETTEPMDYRKYLSFAGIDINTDLEYKTSYGLELRKNKDEWTITNIDRNSPAWETGVSVDDIILKVNGKPANAETVEEILKPVQNKSLTIRISRRTGEKEFTIKTFQKQLRSYKMSVSSGADNVQKKLLQNWIQE